MKLNSEEIVKILNVVIGKTQAVGLSHIDKDILENGGFQFVNQRFADIASCLERHFAVTIHIDDADIAEERYFASFINNESVDDILDVLNSQNYMKIVRSGKIIHISHNK